MPREHLTGALARERRHNLPRERVENTAAKTVALIEPASEAWQGRPISVSAVDPIFLAKKILQFCRQNTCQLLPCNHPATHQQFVDSNRSHDRVPMLA